jgi:hypothetical protein
MKTEKELIREAVEVQNASNLSGVVHSFARAMKDLWRIADEQNAGTDFVNKHRVSRLYASKIQSLAGDVKFGDFSLEGLE